MMFSCEYSYYRRRPRTWKRMSRWQRKQFHRENESLVRQGKKPKSKP